MPITTRATRSSVDCRTGAESSATSSDLEAPRDLSAARRREALIHALSAAGISERDAIADRHLGVPPQLHQCKCGGTGHYTNAEVHVDFRPIADLPRARRLCRARR